MKITNLICSAGRTGFYFDDQRAIKAGARSDPAELEALARRVVSGEVRYCPHGRPVSVKLTKTELDKNFKRIV